MKNTFKLAFAILLILLINGCGKAEKKEQESIEKETAIVHREFGKWKTENDNFGVEITTAQFDNWLDLTKRAGTIVCNDSIPKITLKTANEIRTIYFRNPCWEDESYKIIKSKNIIEIHNDTIFKHQKGTFPLDSLERVLKKDFNNNGIDPLLSENSEKLLVFISYDEYNGFKNLSSTLDQITETYYGITNKTDVKIWLTDKDYFKPPPKPEKNNRIK